ncbi:MAG TPA: hypothetical protein PKE63_08380 [Lacibacter sp.]|nr:hypothetical protein [Lacibacter sp.]HMO88278.1 hypothetical protein [Lacibacter sp.]HMP87281.1 hypothetical protein [Lacibacter sp.]
MEVTPNGTLLAQPAATRMLGVLFSWLLHPLLLIVWITLYLLYGNRTVFLGIAPDDRLLVFLRIFSTSVFLPLVTVFLLKGLGFVQSIQLRTQKERIVPIVACITFFFWSFYVSKQLNDPLPLKAFLLGLFITASVSLLQNNYMKISLHTLGAGGLIALFLLLLFTNQLDSGWSLVLALAAGGLIGTSRLLTGSHRAVEIYAGYITGFVVQLIAWWILA